MRTISSKGENEYHIITDILMCIIFVTLNVGVHECIVKTKASSFSDLQKHSTFDAKLELQVVVEERPKQERVSSNSLSISFLPAFYVHNKELKIGTPYPSQVNIGITATEEVFLHLTLKSSNSTVLKILPPETDESNVNLRSYPIQLNTQLQWRASESPVSTSVVISCSSTSQEVIIPVTVTVFGDGPGKLV